MIKDRPPIEEIAKRVGEAGAGLVIAAHAAALIDQVRMQRDYSERVNNSHEIQNDILRDLAGLTEKQTSEAPNNGGEDVGDIKLVVTGDIYGDKAVQVLRNQQVVQQPPTEVSAASLPVAAVLEEAKSSGMSTAAKVLTALGASALGGTLIPAIGIGLAGLFGAFDKPAEVQQPAAVVDTDTFTVPTTIVKPHRPTDGMD